jgi:hypothetical protein
MLVISKQPGNEKITGKRDYTAEKHFLGAGVSLKQITVMSQRFGINSTLQN